MGECRLLAWGLALFACAGTPPQPPPTPAQVAVASAKPEPETPVPPGPAEPPLPEVREPTPWACRLGSGSWSFDRLRLSSGGKVFAKVRAAPAAVVLPVTEKAAFATAVLDDGRITIRAIVDAGDLELHARAQTAKRGPTFLLGVVMPRAEASLRWVASTADRASVSLDVEGVLTAPSPVVDQVFCDQVGLDFADFDARTVITKKTKLPKRWVARDGVELRRSVSAKPSAQLAGGVEVEVLEVRGSMTDILHDTPSFLVVGWVLSKELTTVPAPGLGHGVQRGGYARGFSSFRGDTCPKDLPLVVEMGTERTRVGTIRGGNSFRILDRPPPDGSGSRARKRQGWIQVELPDQKWLELDASARFSVSATDLESCQERTP